MTSRYWQMVVLTNTGQCQVKVIARVRHWYQGLLASDHRFADNTDHEIQTHLWEVWQAKGEDALLALLCLRCWLSSQITIVCNQLASQFGERYGFLVDELWPLVLDDDCQLEPVYESLSIKILKCYDPAKSALSTWATRMTKGHSEITQFCWEHGLYRISDWALLNDTSPSNLQKLEPPLSVGELQEKSALLVAYHRVYRQHRMMQRQQIGRTSRCQEPTCEQLHAIMPDKPPMHVLNQLRELASQVRAHRIAVRRGMPQTSSLDDVSENQQSISHATENCGEQDDFAQRYRSYFLGTLDGAIETVTLRYAESYHNKKVQKGQLFLSALDLFYGERLSMGAIAQQLGLSDQPAVSRLLVLKRFREEVRDYWFKQLKQQVETESLRFMSPERLSSIDQQLGSLLMEEIDAVMKEAAAKAQSAKTRRTTSTFAERLCALLPAIRASFNNKEPPEI